MKCQYCHTFTKIPKSLRRMEGIYPAPKISYRYCRHVHKEVTCESEACPQFETAPHFWCKKWYGWIHIVVCLARRRKKIYPCVYCKQYLEVEDVAVGRDLFGKFGVRRRVFKPIKRPNTEKPELKRRKADQL